MKGTPVDIYEMRAKELLDEQYKRYVSDKKEASAFLNEPFELAITARIKQYCDTSKTADPLDYEF